MLKCNFIVAYFKKIMGGSQLWHGVNTLDEHMNELRCTIFSTEGRTLDFPSISTENSNNLSNIFTNSHYSFGIKPFKQPYINVFVD